MPKPGRDWEESYQKKDTPWDSGVPCQELQRYLDEGLVKTGRMLELGTGTGTNAVYLAQKGFDVVAVDLSSTAIEKAKVRASTAGVNVCFRQMDILNMSDMKETFPLVYDRGVYHVLRNVDIEGFRKALEKVTEPGSLYLTMAGNANEISPPNQGPPRVHAHEMCSELSPLFDLVLLRECHFEAVYENGERFSPLAWSALWRRK